MGIGKEIVSEAGRSTKMQCMECGAKFRKKIGPRTFEVKCPKCGSYDTDVAESRGQDGKVIEEARRETLMSYVDAVYLGWCNDMLKALKGELTHKPTKWKVGASRMGIGVDFETTDKSDIEVKGHVFLLARAGKNFASISAGITTDNAYTGRKSEDLMLNETMTFDQMVEELRRRLESMGNV